MAPHCQLTGMPHLQVNHTYVIGPITTGLIHRSSNKPRSIKYLPTHIIKSFTVHELSTSNAFNLKFTLLRGSTSLTATRIMVEWRMPTVEKQSSGMFFIMKRQTLIKCSHGFFQGNQVFLQLYSMVWSLLQTLPMGASRDKDCLMYDCSWIFHSLLPTTFPAETFCGYSTEDHKKRFTMDDFMMKLTEALRTFYVQYGVATCYHSLIPHGQNSSTDAQLYSLYTSSDRQVLTTKKWMMFDEDKRCMMDVTSYQQVRVNQIATIELTDRVTPSSSLPLPLPLPNPTVPLPPTVQQQMTFVSPLTKDVRQRLKEVMSETKEKEEEENDEVVEVQSPSLKRPRVTVNEESDFDRFCREYPSTVSEMDQCPFNVEGLPELPELNDFEFDFSFLHQN